MYDIWCSYGVCWNMKSYRYGARLPTQLLMILYFSLFGDEIELLKYERDKIEKYVEINYLLDLWKPYEFEIRYPFKACQTFHLRTLPPTRARSERILM